MTPGGYAPQDILIPDSQDITSSSADTGGQGPSPQGTSAQSSEIYSSVVVVHVSADDEKEAFQQVRSESRETWDLPSSSEKLWDKAGTSPNPTRCGLQASPDLDACESDLVRPLNLHTERDANGQLTLSSLYPFDSCTKDTLSPLNPETKPLLSDLIECTTDGPTLTSLLSFDGSEWSDSGCDDSTVNSPSPTMQYCNSRYFPSQKVAPDFHQQSQNTPSSDVIFESGYKENHLSAMAFMTAYKRQL